MRNLITLLIVLWGMSVNAQITKTIHQTFELEEEVQSVSMDIYDEFETETWAGNTVMTVTRIELVSGAQHILDFYVKEGRYDLEFNAKKTAVSLISKDQKRKGMKYKDLMVYENVKMKIYIPENFERKGNRLIKKVEETASADQ